RNRHSALALSLMFFRYFRLDSCAKKFTILLSKSSPPKCVAFTSNTPWSIVKIETSEVPPPKSKIKMFFSPVLDAFLSRP
ncbi:hypothetical protein SELMODRAFT_124157, partial [Selaginella moellendorffii]